MKEEKRRERSRREIKRGKLGVGCRWGEEAVAQQKLQGLSSGPLLSPDSTRNICFTNYMKNSDIGGQTSFLIVLWMTDYLVFYLQVAITDFFFACLNSKHIVCQKKRFFAGVVVWKAKPDIMWTRCTYLDVIQENLWRLTVNLFLCSQMGEKYWHKMCYTK